MSRLTGASCVAALAVAVAIAAPARAQPRGANEAAPRRDAAKAPKQQPKEQRPAATEDLDRVVVRWHSRATGGVTKPRFVTARELAFEARLQALGDGVAPTSPYKNKHVRAAIQHHIAESILASLPVQPKPTPKQIGSYAETARVVIEQRIGGRSVLNRAANREGIDSDELNALLRRRARASWYLDKMVAPMLKPSDIDLREVHRRGETPYTKQAFELVAQPLRNWYVATRLAAALDTYYRSIRSRVTVQLITY